MIDPGDFNPEAEEHSFDGLRKAFQDQWHVLREIVRRLDGESDAESDSLDSEAVDEAMRDLEGFAIELMETIDYLLLLNAFKVYFYNPSYRDDVKAEGSSEDAEEELLARWSREE